VRGVALQLAPRLGSPADALALGVSGSATSDLATHGRSFAHLSTPFPSGNGALYAALQGLECASAQLSAERPRAVAIRPVLGTTVAYVDRSAVRLRVQLLAADGSAQVTTSGLDLTLDVARGASRVSASCAVADVTRAASYFLARCEVAALPSPWFAVPSLATATVTLRYQNAVVAAADAGALTLVEQPVWYGAAQLARVRPAARPLAPAGAFAAMPVSPVYAGDVFAVAIYAHTGGFALETWWVLVDVATESLAYVSHLGSSAFKGVVFRQYPLNDTHTQLSFTVVGTRATTTGAQVTAAALPLLTLQLRAAAGLGAGRHARLLGVTAKQFINPGTYLFVEDSLGVVVDPTTGLAGAAQGGLEVVPVVDVGLLAYGPAGTLPNLAPLTGQAAAFPVKAARVSDDYRLASSNVAGAAATCATDGALVPAVLAAFEAGAPCDVRLTAAQTRGDVAVGVQVSLGNLSASVGFSV